MPLERLYRPALLLAVAVALLVAWQLWTPRRDAAGFACPWSDPAQTQWIAGSAQSRELVVMLHAYASEPGAMCQVGEWLRRHRHPQPDLLVPKLALGIFSQTPIEQVVQGVSAEIDARWAARAKAGDGGYARLRLIGHSMGALIVRRVYEEGLTPGPRATPGLAANTPSKPWALKTERIVLFAGVNRGWSIDHHMSLMNSVVYQAGEVVNVWLEALGGPPFTVMAARHGAPFVNDLRLRWQVLPKRWDELARTQPGFKPPLVVQLLGTVDDIVPPGDNVDAASAAGFVWLQVPHSGHVDVIRVLADAELPGAAAERAGVLARAWADTPPETDTVPMAVRRARPDACMQHVIFVMHGIRDEGHWTERVAAAVEDALEPTLAIDRTECQGRREPRIAFEISSYGYFPMLSFLRPGARREKVAWLLDRYAEARALYPNAQFHYVGHSHGTYLLREALRQVPGVEFKKVVLAGSVLRVEEPWQRFFDSGQVGRLLNLRASADWVVAIFPNTMERIGWQDLGGAGFRGFNQPTQGLTNGPQRDGKLAYVEGGHGTAVDEHAWRTIATFVAQGELDPAGLPVVGVPDGWVDWAARWGLLLWALLLAVLFVGLWCLLRWRVREGVKAIAVLAYFGAIWLVITRL